MGLNAAAAAAAVGVSASPVPDNTLGVAHSAGAPLLPYCNFNGSAAAALPGYSYATEAASQPADTSATQSSAGTSPIDGPRPQQPNNNASFGSLPPLAPEHELGAGCNRRRSSPPDMSFHAAAAAGRLGVTTGLPWSGDASAHAITKDRRNSSPAGASALAMPPSADAAAGAPAARPQLQLQGERDSVKISRERSPRDQQPATQPRSKREKYHPYAQQVSREEGDADKGLFFPGT